jgi:hypothetical protein
MDAEVLVLPGLRPGVVDMRWATDAAKGAAILGLKQTENISGL